MSVQFQATRQQEEILQEIEKRVAVMTKELSTYMDDVDKEKMDRLANDIRKKIDKFKSVDRKLTLAVIGRVKAGKSSFLNELVFQGKDVLPHAFRPKTATLTKIEYDENPHLTIEYYRPEEWKRLEELARQEESVRDDVKTAKELIADVKSNGLDVYPYLEKGKETIAIPDEDVMESILNEYVGANGKLTAIVKSVVLCIKRPELEGISIVDTPGTNDPIQSRTQTTKDFLAECDVVFFLTTASQALDRQDIDLLKTQLPGQGVGDIRLIASRFDEAVLDASYDKDSLREVIASEKQKFQKNAARLFEGYADEYMKQGRTELGKLMQACTTPYFQSSLMHRMIGKRIEQYTEQERNTYENLNDANGDMTPELVRTLGDMSDIEAEFREMIAHKDEKLALILKNMIPGLDARIREDITLMAARAKERRVVLESHDQKEILAQKKEMGDRILDAKSHVAECFGQIMFDMEQVKSAIVSELHSISANRDSLVERTGTETRTGVRTVSESCWYKFWNGFKTERDVFYTYEAHYKYINVSDALENVRKQAHYMQEATDSRMADCIDLKGLKGKLLSTIVDHMDTDSLEFNSNQLRLIVQETLNKVEIPIFRVSLEDAIVKITDRFSGEVRNDGDRETLKQMVSRASDDLVDALIRQITSGVSEFKGKIEGLQRQFIDVLLQEVNAEFENLGKQAAEKEKSIRDLKSYEALLAQNLK